MSRYVSTWREGWRRRAGLRWRPLTPFVPAPGRAGPAGGAGEREARGKRRRDSEIKKDRQEERGWRAESSRWAAHSQWSACDCITRRILARSPQLDDSRSFGRRPNEFGSPVLVWWGIGCIIQFVSDDESKELIWAGWAGEQLHDHSAKC